MKTKKKPTATKVKLRKKPPAVSQPVEATAPAPRTAIHQWTHDGAEVLLLKCVNADGTSYNGFRWPLEVGATVEAPDWNNRAECGGGLHGWPWGMAIGDGKEPDWSSKWIVFGAPAEAVVDLGGKCKARRGVIRYVGGWVGALAFLQEGRVAWAEKFAEGKHATGDRSASSATGDQSASSATGDQSASSATGDRSASSATGDQSASSATGDQSASSATGDQSASSATGYRSASSATGDRSASSATGYQSASIVTGLEGRARAGKYGCIALGWWNARASRGEMRCAEIGCGDGSDGKLKADVWYVLDEKGAFVEVAS